MDIENNNTTANNINNTNNIKTHKTPPEMREYYRKAYINRKITENKAYTKDFLDMCVKYKDDSQFQEFISSKIRNIENIIKGIENLKII